MAATLTTFYYSNGTTSTSADSELTRDSYSTNPSCQLASVVVGTLVTSIGYGCFLGMFNDSLSSISIPNTVTNIGDSSFYSCQNLTEITIPSSVTSLGDNSFNFCRSITTISIPDSVTYLGFGAFSSCQTLSNVTLSNSLTALYSYTFSNCPFASIHIPNSITIIDAWCFNGCYNLTTIMIPSSVTQIGERSFRNCSSLTQVTFDDQRTLTTLDPIAFTGCNNLQHVTYVNAANINALTPLSLQRQSNFPNYTNPGFFIYDASCFAEGSLILALNKEFQEEWIPVEKLQKGDLVKTYLHGYRKIVMIGKNIGQNIKEGNLSNLFKQKKPIDGFAPLCVTGWHGLLIDEPSRNNPLKVMDNVMIDDKKILEVGHSEDFEEMDIGTIFTFYNFVVEPNEDEKQRFGVWANGVLCETPNKKLYSYHEFL